VAAFLGQVRGYEIDGEALGRQREAERDERAPDTLFGLVHGLVGQADNVEAHDARRKLNLDLDGLRLDADKGDGEDARKAHRVPESALRTA
jgi:hypothetical protein